MTGSASRSWGPTMASSHSDKPALPDMTLGEVKGMAAFITGLPRDEVCQVTLIVLRHEQCGNHSMVVTHTFDSENDATRMIAATMSQLLSGDAEVIGPE